MCISRLLMGVVYLILGSRQPKNGYDEKNYLSDPEFESKEWVFSPRACGENKPSTYKKCPARSAKIVRADLGKPLPSIKPRPFVTYIGCYSY